MWTVASALMVIFNAGFMIHYVRRRDYVAAFLFTAFAAGWGIWTCSTYRDEFIISAEIDCGNAIIAAQQRTLSSGELIGKPSPFPPSITDDR